MYALVDPRDGKRRYVGKTSEPHRRLAHHRYLATRKKASDPLYEWMREVKAQCGAFPDMVLLSVGSAGDGDNEEREAIRSLDQESLNRVRYLRHFGEDAESRASAARRQVLAVRKALAAKVPQQTLGEWARSRAPIRPGRKNGAVEKRIVDELLMTDDLTSRELSTIILGDDERDSLKAMRSILCGMRQLQFVVKEYPNGHAGPLGTWTTRGARPFKEVADETVDAGRFELLAKQAVSFTVVILDSGRRLVVPLSAVADFDALCDDRLVVRASWARRVGL